MSINFLSYFMSQAGRSLLSENMIIVAIVLWTLRGSFRKIEAGLADITHTVRELKTALVNVELRHANRLDGIEIRLTHLEDKHKQTANDSGGSGG